MGVMCQIHLHKPPDGVYKPGSVVAGHLKYALDQDTEYQDIILALRGKGRCHWTQHNGSTTISYTGTEKYVDTQTNILEKKTFEPQLVRVGAYSVPFRFILPSKIPPSYKDGTCKIIYYVSIKFIKPGLFNTTRKFKTVVPVLGFVENNMPDGAIMHGLQKQLSNIFGKVNGDIKLNATVSKSFVEPCGNVEIVYDIENDANVNITRVTTNLIEKIKYTANCGSVKRRSKKFAECKSAIEAIKSQHSERCAIVVPTLPEMNSVQYSRVFSKYYKILVNVKLPMPHRNATLAIPLVIGQLQIEQPVSQDLQLEEAPMEGAPPSYWEVMEEENTGESSSKKPL